MIGEEKTFSLWKFYQLSKLKKLGQAILNKCCPHINATTYVRDLTLEDQKMVEIARATATWPQVLLVDETSAALSKKNVDCLFDIMREAAKNGSIVLFITHRMEEVFEMCDKVVVLKDGKLVGMKDTSSTTVDELSQMMVGRTVAITGIHKHALPEDLEQKKVLLRVQNLSYQDVFHGVNFEVKQGHIVGIGGLTGSGKEAILPTIFGDLKHSTGKIEFFGKEETNPTPAKSIAAGIAYLPKEREKEGLILRHSIMANIVLASIKDLAKYRFFVNPGVYKSIGEKYSRVLNVKCNSINDLVDSLSGGNRQKVVVARWISRKSNIMLLDNPTRGIDVGSRAEIYSLIEDLVKQGVGFVMTSDDMPELLSMSDEVYVIRKGEVSKHFSLGERPEEKDVVRYMI